jgi:CheY-like chemotaxis protein
VEQVAATHPAPRDGRVPETMAVRPASCQRSRSVLIVEDDTDLLEMMAIVLADAGFRVRKAANGLEALEAVRRDLPCVILLDMKMPVMDGWEFARRFRAEFDRLAPIIVVTAAADAQARAQEIEAEGYLAKPFDIDDLLQIVEHFVTLARPS